MLRHEAALRAATQSHLVPETETRLGGGCGPDLQEESTDRGEAAPRARPATRRPAARPERRAARRRVAARAAAAAAAPAAACAIRRSAPPPPRRRTIAATPRAARPPRWRAPTAALHSASGSTVSYFPSDVFFPLAGARPTAARRSEAADDSSNAPRALTSVP